MLIISFAPRRIQHTGRPDTQLRLLKEPNEELVLLREGLIGGVLGEETAPVTELEGLVDCGIEGGPLLRVCRLCCGCQGSLASFIRGIH